MADDDYAYLSGLSSHPGRAGDTSNFNPAFAAKLATAIRNARASGLNVGVESGFREPGQTGSAYDAGGNSSHSYGLAADISGLDGANGSKTQAWAKFASDAGLFNPYGVGNRAEFNHYQFTSQPLEQIPGALDALKAAKATGDMQAVWNAAPGAGGTAVAAAAQSGGSGQYLSQRDAHIQFIRDYANKIGLDPNLALGIAGAEGLNAWSAKNPAAGSGIDIDKATGQPFSYGDFQLNVHPGAVGAQALAAGIDPRDPSQWQAADKFALDQMKAKGVGAWSGDPVAKQYLASGKVSPFVPGNTLNTSGGPSVGSQSATGGPGAGAGGVSSTPGTSSTGQPSGALAGNLPGFQPNSPGAKMTAQGLQALAGGGGGQDQPPPPPPGPAAAPAMAAGGQMMMGPGGMNTFGQRSAQQAMAQRGGVANMAPVAGWQPANQMTPDMASGMPSMPGTTLNSPSQLQMALMTGAINPYDLYSRSPAFSGS